jgi:D-alanine-D-alanine ligase
MQRIKVAVLRGGPSSEYEVSLLSGKNVINNLSDKHIPTDVFIDRSGLWHVDGVPVKFEKLFQDHDVVFNALHGEYGEDGKVQQILDAHKAKYTGSGALPSAIAMNKLLAKKIFEKFHIKTPVYRAVQRGEENETLAMQIFKTFPMPAIIKPSGTGSSHGLSLVKTMKEILPALKKALKYSEIALLEEQISGREATCGVIENFRDQKFYPLPPIEIKHPASELFDYDAKYSGKSEEICPGNFTEKEKEMIEKAAIEAHKALGLRHYSRSDFIVNPRRGIYILETNSLPGLTKESLMPKALKAVGSSLTQFLDHVIGMAMEEK